MLHDYKFIMIHCYLKVLGNKCLDTFECGMIFGLKLKSPLYTFAQKLYVPI